MFVRNEDRDCKTAIVRAPIQIASELWLGTLGHTMHRIVRGCSSARIVRLASPSFSGGRLFYIARLQEAVSLRARSLATGATTGIRGPDCTSLAAGDVLYLSQETSCPSPEPDDPVRREIDRLA